MRGARVPWGIVLAALVGAASCLRMGLDPLPGDQDATDGDADSDGDADADGDTDTDADGDTDGDGAADAEADAVVDGDAPDADSPPDDAVSVYFAEGDGLTDARGTGPTGSCIHCPVSVLTGHGLAWDFDGTDEVDIADDGRIDWTAGFTVAFHVLPRNVVAFTCFVMKIFGAGYLNTFKLGIRPDLDFETTESGLVDRMRSGVALTAGAWVHLAITWDGTTKRLYVDGVEVGSEPAPAIEQDSSTIVVGADRDLGAGKEWLDGLLRDLRLYDRALSPTEIAALAP